MPEHGYIYDPAVHEDELDLAVRARGSQFRARHERRMYVSKSRV